MYVDYDYAMSLIEENKYDLALPLLEKLAANGDEKGSYMVGYIYFRKFEELGLDRPLYEKAFIYLKIAAENGNSKAQKELGLLLTKKESGHKKLSLALKWIFKSGDYNNGADLKLISKILGIIYSSADLESIESIKKRIVVLNEYLLLTKNFDILSIIKKYKKSLINSFCRLMINNSSSVEDLYNGLADINADIENDFFYETKKSFYDKEIDLFLEKNNSVKNAKKYLENFNDKKLADKLYKFIGFSYFKGINGVKKNIDLAIKYYINSKSKDELDNLLIEQCEDLISNGDLERAEKYIEHISVIGKKEYIYSKILLGKQKQYFLDIESKANLYKKEEDILEIARLYKLGFGVAINFDKSLEIYEKLFYENKSKKAFDILYDHYITIDIEKIKQYLNYANKNNIEFDYNKRETYKKLFMHYATSKYEFKNTLGISKIDDESNIIYFLYDYYKKSFVVENPGVRKYIDNHNAFMAVKNRVYDKNKSPLKFHLAIYNFLSLVKGEWIICTMPGHVQTLNFSNGITDVMENIFLNNNFLLRNTLIMRKYTVEKKAFSQENRVNDYTIDMKSLELERRYNIKGKNIIVIDDITTSGSSLIACRNLLMNNGAKKVILLALGKTKESFYGYR